MYMGIGEILNTRIQKSKLACEIGTGALICEMAMGALGSSTCGAVPEEGGARIGGGNELRLSLTPEPA